MYVFLCHVHACVTSLLSDNITTVVLISATSRYFLIGPGVQRLAAMNTFITELGLQERHVERVMAYDRKVLEQRQGRVLRYLAFSRKMITREWVRYL